MNLSHKIADLIGYDLVRTGKDILLPRHLRNLFHLAQIDCVLDVGANHGQYGKMLRDLGYRGRIISFEPVSASYQRLQATAARDLHWDVYNFALGAKEEKLEINVTAASDFASFLPPSDFSRQTFGETITVEKREQVMIKRLDDIFAEVTAGQKAYAIHLKMDTQGYDLEVLRGGQTTIKKITTLQSELSVLPVYDGMPDYLKALADYRRAGFEVTGIFPVSRHRESLTVIEFDCVLHRQHVTNQTLAAAWQADHRSRS